MSISAKISIKMKTIQLTYILRLCSYYNFTPHGIPLQCAAYNELNYYLICRPLAIRTSISSIVLLLIFCNRSSTVTAHDTESSYRHTDGLVISLWVEVVVFGCACALKFGEMGLELEKGRWIGQLARENAYVWRRTR